nr:MAG TPA: hypothetical protein [Caudoviricetes sp.]
MTAFMPSFFHFVEVDILLKFRNINTSYSCHKISSLFLLFNML